MSVDFERYRHFIAGEAVVYRCYDTSGTLLYVGYTTRLRDRIANHRSQTPWWPAVIRIETEPPVDTGIAQRLELDQIKRLAPLHNKMARPQGGLGRPSMEGLRLRELREARGLKLYDVSVAIRTDPSTIWRWEAKRCPIPDKAKKQLADLFNVTRSHLMGWDEPGAA